MSIYVLGAVKTLQLPVHSWGQILEGKRPGIGGLQVPKVCSVNCNGRGSAGTGR